jgi:hypothetical protein
MDHHRQVGDQDHLPRRDEVVDVHGEADEEEHDGVERERHVLPEGLDSHARRRAHAGVRRVVADDEAGGHRGDDAGEMELLGNAERPDRCG